MYFNRASSLTGIRRLAASIEADFKEPIRSAGLSMSLFQRPDERIAFNDTCALFEHCARAWDMPDFGLRLAPFHHLEMLGPVALVTKLERDLRSAMTAVTRNLVLHTNAVFATLEEEGDVAAMAIEAADVPAGTKQFTLLSVGVARNVLEQVGEAKVDLIEATFRYEATGLDKAASQFFGCPVRFGAEKNAIYFNRADLDRKLNHNDTAYRALIERYLYTTRQEIAEKTSDGVRREVSRQMEFGSCTLESVARSLRQESRSLQRRLQQEGTSFRDIVDDWRRQRALSLVSNTRLPLSEISLALGYSNQSIFSRAFQRWYGQGPLAYRQNILQEAV